MPIVKVANSKRLERDKSRVLGTLQARLPEKGLDQEKLPDFLAELGLKYTKPELDAIVDALVADGELSLE